MIPYFKVDLNLPHAATIAGRIYRIITSFQDLHNVQDLHKAVDLSEQIINVLIPYKVMDQNPDKDKAEEVCQTTAVLARDLVAQIEQQQLQGDRLGQCVRNLFECLEMGREGAIISLRAGENPDSLQRPI